MIKRILHIILLAILTLIFSVLFLVMTHGGLKITLILANKLTGGNFYVKESAGSLINHFSLTDLHCQNKRFSINIDSLDLSWRPLALLGGRFYIQALSVKNTEINLPVSVSSKKENKQSAHKNNFSFKLPVAISAYNINLDKITIQQGKKTHTIQSIKFDGYTWKDKISIQQANINYYPHILNLSGDFYLKMPFYVNLTSQLITAFPAYHTIYTDTTLKGDMNTAYNLTIKVSKPFIASIIATLKSPLTEEKIAVTGQWKKILFPISENDDLSSSAGEISVNGNLKNYQFNLKTEMAGTHIPDGHWTLTGNGGSTQINFKTISANILGGQANGRLQVTWKPNIILNAEFSGNHLNPGIQWPNFTGNINFHFASQADLSHAPSFLFILDKLNGSLNNHSLLGYANISLLNKQVNLNKGQIKLGDDAFNFSGRIANRWLVNWELKAPDIIEIAPNATGEINSQGTIVGERKTPHVVANLNIKNLGLHESSLESLDCGIDFYLSHQNSSINLLAKNLIIHNHQIDNIQLSANGTLEKNTIVLQTKALPARVSLHVNGSHQDNKTIFKATSFNMTSKTWGNWQLKEPFNLSFLNNAITVSPFSIDSNNSNISGNMNYQENGAGYLKLMMTQFPAKIFNGLLPKNTQADSMLNINADLTRNSHRQLSGSVKISTDSSSTIQYTEKINESITLPKTTFTALFDNNGLMLNLLLDTTPTQSIASVNLPGYFGERLLEKSQPLSGNLNLNISSLKFLSLIIPDISHTNGQLTTNLKATGSYGYPLFTGNIQIKNANTTVNDLGVAFDKINFLLDANNSDQFDVTGSINSGNSQLTVNGTAGINQFKFPFILNFTGNNFLFYNTKDYEFYASPKLKFSYDRPTMALSGALDIPKANISPQDFSSAVTLPTNVMVIKNSNADNLESMLDFYFDLDLTFGNDVYLDTSGITAKVGGNLKINASPMQLTTARGQINITDGNYKAYGNQLKIRKGNLIYTGGTLDNPGLNITAIKSIKNINMGSSVTSNANGSTYAGESSTLTVGLDVTGTLKSPKVSFFSNPSGLSKTDILSYLIFGFPSNSASGGQAQLLIAAAEASNIGGGITKNLKQTFGLNELGLESSNVMTANSDASQQNTSFIMGKYLTPKIYASYSVGLLIPINIFTLKYYLDKHWMAQSDASSLDTGSDIFYTIQTD